MKKILLILFLCGCENTISEFGPEPNGVDYGVVINEINYNSSTTLDAGDWIELYNNTDENIEISLWEFRDEDNLFIVPENTVLSPENFLVLCQSIETFSEVFPDIENVLGGFEFGLNGGGESISLTHANGMVVDEVEYDDISPWPSAADGEGRTLELIDPQLDNSLGSNWSASNVDGGTPGEMNSNE